MKPFCFYIQIREKLHVVRDDVAVFGWNPRSLATFCRGQETRSKGFCKNFFQYSVTNKGICLSYNALSLSEILSPTSYQKVSSAIFDEKENR